jgi:hypothetical protein
MFAIQWDDRLLPAYKAKCDILLGQLGRNQLAFIREHTNLGNDCYRTDFSNGCTVQVDYANKRLTVDDQSVTLPDVFDRDIPFRREP